MRYITFLIFFLYASSSFAQTNVEDIFRNLKNGAILVRLQTKQNVLKALEGKNDALAEKIKQKQANENREITEAFSKSFSLCPTYYFYSYNSRKIADKQFKNILLDKDLNPISELPVLDKNYLIATFSTTQTDTTSYSMGTYLSQNYEKSSLERKERYGGSSMASGVDALILLSPDLIALQSPYPHYVRTFERLPFINRTRERTIELLQYKIEKYIKNK